MKTIIQSLLIFSLLSSTATTAEDYPVIQVYTQDELNSLIKKNQHLQRVKADDCQLVQDIEAHALKIQEPSYVFLWGDMLAWGVCVERDATLGMYYIDQAAKQGLLAAIEQLGRYYNNGTLVIKDKDKATKYFREAALQGNLPAKISYIKLLDQGYGSPLDYEDAYRALNSSIIVNPKTKKEAERLLAKLAKKMPEYAITNARKNYND
jgi:TPR repeat protein